MKKLFFLLAACGYYLSAIAQAPANDTAKGTFKYDKDNLLSRWVIDVNLLGGVLNQKCTTVNSSGNYPNGINVIPGELKFHNGASFGLDAQLGYFFGHSNHFGVGLGISYLAQSGNATLDTFHTEYKSTDALGRVFRQVVSPDQQISEKLRISNLNIPLLLKYKDRLSKHWGFTADAGAIINLQIANAYKTNASFDYGGIYEYTSNGGTVYDNSVIPGTSDLLLTKAHYLQNTPDGNVQNYFVQSAAEGYKVGLGVKPGSNSGNVSSLSGSVGFLLRPAVNYYLSDNIALTAGAYYLYQPFKSNVQSGYELTNNPGNYSSVLHSVSSISAQSYGLSLGVRIYVFKPKDTDGDGVPDKRDRCPAVYGKKQFNGCADTDGDGVADPDDSCPTVPGLAAFNGCPDSDGDGIPDKDDACPYQIGIAKFHGCPDSDGDGIPDKDDQCPIVAGPAKFLGCPDTDNDGVPDNEDRCPSVAGPVSNGGCPLDTAKIKVAHKPERLDLSTPVLFDVGKTEIKESSFPILNEVARILAEVPGASIIVDGYTDNTGSDEVNLVLSQKRALAVKKYMMEKGVGEGQVKTVGHGKKFPATTNDTEQGRAQNRRVRLELSTSNE